MSALNKLLKEIRKIVREEIRNEIELLREELETNKPLLSESIDEIATSVKSTTAESTPVKRKNSIEWSDPKLNEILGSVQPFSRSELSEGSVQPGSISATHASSVLDAVDETDDNPLSKVFSRDYSSLIKAIDEKKK